MGDRPLAREPGALGQGVQIVYVSPLKALSYDVERNLRAPLQGIGAEHRRRPAHRRHAAAGAPGDAAQAAGHPDHDARVALPDDDLAGARDPHRRRGGDRRRDPRGRPVEARRPPGADAGAALAPGRPSEGGPRARSGSGSRRPSGRWSGSPQFLVGPKRECEIVNAGIRKDLDLEIVVPVEDMAEPGARPIGRGPSGDGSRFAARAAHRSGSTRARSSPRSTRRANPRSIWPAIYPELLSSSASTPRRSSSSTTAAAPSASRSASTSCTTSNPTRSSRRPSTRERRRTPRAAEPGELERRAPSDE